MMVNSDQADTKFKYICTTCSYFVQIQFDAYGIDSSIDIQILNNPHYIWTDLEDFDNGRKSDIENIKKERGYIIS